MAEKIGCSVWVIFWIIALFVIGAFCAALFAAPPLILYALGLSPLLSAVIGLPLSVLVLWGISKC